MGEAKPMAVHNLALPDWDRVNVPENLGKAAALPALPLITLLYILLKKDIFWKLDKRAAWLLENLKLYRCLKGLSS